jgi:hypothetical protein
MSSFWHLHSTSVLIFNHIQFSNFQQQIKISSNNSSIKVKMLYDEYLSVQPSCFYFWSCAFYMFI